MEKQVNDKAEASAADHDEHNLVHSGDDKEDTQHIKEHKDGILDSEGKVKSTAHEMHDDGNKGAGHQSKEIPLLHEKHAFNDTDTGATCAFNENIDTHVNFALENENAGTIREHEGMPATHEKQELNVEHAPGKSATHAKQEHNEEHAPGKSATHEKPEHNVEHAPLTPDPPENTPCGVPTSLKEHADTTHESNKDQVLHEKVSHDHEVLAVAHELMEKSATDENATHDDGHVGLGHEFGERHKTHEKVTHDDEHVGVAHESGETHTTHKKHAYNAQNAEGTTEEKLTHTHTDMDTTLHSKHMHDEEAGHTPGDKSLKHGDVAGVAHEHGHTCRCNVVHADAPQEHGEKCRSEDDECESKKAFSDENSLKERVHFSRGSTPDVDTPTQQTSSPFSNTKPSKPGSKGAGNAERCPGSADGNPETPSTSWAFSARASIAPSKFDHMATLRLTYGAYRESNRGKEGVPLSLLPEILESARFMVPPPRDLVPLLQRIDIEYKVGDLVRWSLLQSLALQIEHKEARYPAVFIPRPSVARPNSNSPNSWKALQRSPTRRTHPEDDCPELEPQLAWGFFCLDRVTASVSTPSSS